MTTDQIAKLVLALAPDGYRPVSMAVADDAVTALYAAIGDTVSIVYLTVALPSLMPVSGGELLTELCRLQRAVATRPAVSAN